MAQVKECVAASVNKLKAGEKQAKSKLSAQTGDAAPLPKMTTVSQQSFDLASEKEKNKKHSLHSL